MKRLIVAGVGILAAGSAALSADLPVKAPPMVPAAVANWTGFYVGVNAGFGWSRSEIDPRGTAAFCNPILIGCPPTNLVPGGIQADIASAAVIPSAINPNGRGGLLGGTVGYNKQLGLWVIGLEADMAWANIVGSDSRSGGPLTITGTTVPTAGFSSVATATTQIRDFGTVRGRVGYTPFAALLLYGTGGLAYARVSSNAMIAESSFGTCGSGSCPFGSASAATSSTRLGWTVGAGGEYRFAGQWSVKGEYLYYDLGRLSYAFSPLTSTGDCGGGAACQFTGVNVTASTSELRGSIIRIGLNYSFGDYGIVTARY